LEILLLGPPNVGKSVLFNKLTGLHVGMANYPGTTVDYKEGKGKIDGLELKLIDAPGTYTLDASNEAEQVAVDLLSDEPAAVVCVLDAKNLESSIYLLLQALEKNLPTIAVINKTDLIEGSIDSEYLSEELGIPVIETVAVDDKGLPELKEKIRKLLSGEILPTSRIIQASWAEAERIEEKASEKLDTSDENWRKKWGERLEKPNPGIFLAILILLVTFLFVVGAGLALRNYILLPFFENLVFPPITVAVERYVVNETIQSILVGEYGFLIKGLEWPFALVLPYIVTFYAALSFLEDIGFLPRLAVLVDGVFKKMSLSGSHIIPFMLGYGCAIPSILSTRTMGNKKNRVILSTMVVLAVPCIAETGAFIALFAEFSIFLVLVLFVFSITSVILAGMVLGKVLKEKRDPIVLEIPELLPPDINILGKKIWIRVKHFIAQGAVPMIIIIGGASLVYETGILLYIGEFLEPFVSGWLGLPKEASTPLILGIFRRELTVLPLLEMELTTLQAFVGGVVGLFYVPCIGVLGVLGKEFGVKTTAAIFALTMVISFTIGGFIAQIGTALI